MKNIKIKINNKVVQAFLGQTILEVAHANHIYIPALCNHPDFKPKGNCGVCVVEIKGEKKLKRACSTKVVPGMEIKTESPLVKKTRNLNIELAFAEHIEKCPTCTLRYNCDLLSMANRYKLKINRFSDRKSKRATYKLGNAVEIDGSQCIDCRNCVDACTLLQKIDYLELKGKGANQEIVPKKDKVCIYCGQCVVHCPVNAACEQAEWPVLEKLLQNKNKIVVAQFAPSIRASIGEEFGLKHGTVLSGQLVTALRQLGFKYVFDVNFGADITTIVEAEELVERIKAKKSLPMFTSCCPAWTRYVEFYQPQLIPNLTSARSPQIHLGGIIKTYWADKMKIAASKIKVVSVMPCTAKKFEATRPELKIDRRQPVDQVITTRELAWLLKKNNINLGKLKPSQADDIFSVFSGAAVIYGATGGVMESALRTAKFMLLGKKDTKQIEFKEVRGLKDFKAATILIGKKKLRVGVVNGIGNIDRVLPELSKYDYIEVMACPGGCIGGGGQPIPTTPEIREKRRQALYGLDKKCPIRLAHENPGTTEVLAYLKAKKKEHQVLHTKYYQQKGK
jgi:iron-only hydrogenase group A